MGLLLAQIEYHELENNMLIIIFALITFEKTIIKLLTLFLWKR